MKKKKLLFITLAIFILGLLGWLHWRSQTLPRAASPAAKARKITDPLTAEEIQAINSANITALAKQRTLADPVIARQYLQALKDGKTDMATLLGPLNLSPEEKQGLQDNPDEARVLMPLLQAMDARNSQSQDVYGKVVDQNGQPIAGVKVLAGTLLDRGPTSGGDEYATETNGAGEFNFLGIHAAGLGIRLQKDGYEFLGSWQRADNYRPDPNDPALLTMYKLQGAEPMVHAKSDSWIPYDGTSINFNLFTGKIDDTGDLKITLIRDPLQVRRGRDHFDWDVKIEIVGGGMLAEHDPYPYMASENGYQPVFEFSESKDNPNWTQKLTRTFYVHTANDTYGRVWIDITTDSDRPEGTGMGIEAYMNPAPGSRNLEFDEKNVVKGQ